MIMNNIKLVLSSLAKRIDHGARAMSARRSGIRSPQVTHEEHPVQQAGLPLLLENKCDPARGTVKLLHYVLWCIASVSTLLFK